MRFQNGWIKSHRSISMSFAMGDVVMNGFWHMLLHMACVEDTTVRFNGKQLPLRRGQILTSLADLSNLSGLSIKRVRGLLKRLVEGHSIGHNKGTDMGIAEGTAKGTAGSVITIINYDEYQGSDKNDGIAKGTAKGTAREKKGHSKGHCIEELRIKKEEIKEELINMSASPLSIVADRAKDHPLVNLWNTNCGVLPKVRSLSSKRKLCLKLRLDEQPDLSYWETAIKKMAASDLCRQGTWASFEFLFKNDNNHLKVMEGNYDNRDSQSQDATDWDGIFAGKYERQRV